MREQRDPSAVEPGLWALESGRKGGEPGEATGTGRHRAALQAKDSGLRPRAPEGRVSPPVTSWSHPAPGPSLHLPVPRLPVGQCFLAPGC